MIRLMIFLTWEIYSHCAFCFSVTFTNGVLVSLHFGVGIGMIPRLFFLYLGSLYSRLFPLVGQIVVVSFIAFKILAMHAIRTLSSNAHSLPKCCIAFDPSHTYHIHPLPI
jgi:hypothetical protein